MIALLTQERVDQLMTDTLYLAALTLHIFERLEKKHPRLFDDDLRSLRDEVKQKFMLDDPPAQEPK